ncbi:MAG: hypothetical protein P4M07_19495 [Xanthobacteraceae bacterium]|nr:hypothetical protein [Xanthobacteraceae bacterium]
MISIVVYGRNDGYGHNLHKRAALSLNCMAEVLSGDDDEIIFVDYNTFDIFPTFPEAIHDVLTARARARLRVLRVRPAVHARLGDGDSAALPVLEAAARNVAIRRSNPRNRWVLSSNTDMIFVPRDRRSLTEIAAGLADGFYGTPRFEVPESLWETFDRRDPAKVISEISALAADFHLHEVVYGSDEFLYDAPGDFQLMLREDLFRIQGFHEGMRRGWHLDANIAKRLSLLRGPIGDALPFVLGYHCDHSRLETHKHAAAGAMDSFDEHVIKVTSPQPPSQPADWGCADEAIEDIRLDGSVNAGHLAALRQAIGARQPGVSEARYRNEDFNQVKVSVAHLLPFLADQFANLPHDFRLCWLGAQDECFAAFTRLWPGLGFRHPIEVVPMTAAAKFGAADGFVINFGVPAALPVADAGPLLAQIFALLEAEDQRRAGRLPPRRVIGVNAVHNDHDRMMRDHFNAPRTPFPTRLRIGYAQPPPAAPLDWLPDMLITEHAERRGDAIVARVGGPCCLAYGPYRCLRPGRYRIEVEVRKDPRTAAARLAGRVLPAGAAEVVVNDAVAARSRIHLLAAEARRDLPLVIGDTEFNAPVQVRIFSRGRVPFAVTGVTLRPLE